MPERTNTLPPDVRNALRAYINRTGLHTACQELGLTAETVARALANLPLRTGTRTHIGVRLAELVKSAA